LASASTGQVIIWDTSGKTLHTLNVLMTSALAISRDGKMLAIGGSHSGAASVRFFDVETGKEKTGGQVRHRLDVLTLAYLDDNLLAVGGKDLTLRVFDVNDGKEAGGLRGHLGWIRSVAVSPEAKTIATASVDNTIKVWDLATAFQGNPI